MTNTPRLRTGRALSGFTLLEVMIVVVMLAMLVAGAAPSVSRQISHSRINNSAATIAGDFEMAFTLAARQRQPLRITVDAANASYKIVNRAGTIIRQRKLNDTSDLHVGAMTTTVSTLNIFPNGLSSGPIVVRVSLNGYTQRITMTRAGQVRVTS